MDSGALINLDKRCGYDVVIAHHMFLKKQRLLKLLTAPRWSPVKFSHTTIENVKTRPTSQLLHKLPQEMIDAIIEVADDKDILPLALTCSYFFRLLAPRAQALMKKDSAPWAGDRLVIIGSYFDEEPDDRSFSCEEIRGTETIQYTEGKIRSVDGLGKRTHWYTTWTDEDDDLSHAEWACEVLSTTSTPPPNPSLNASASALVGVHRDALRINLYKRMKASAADESELELVSRLLNILRQKIDESRYLQDPTQEFHCSHCRQQALKSAVQGAQVLRNLTTKEYVRSSALGGYDGYFTLASPVIKLVHWTDVQPGDPSPFYHGRWSGHRFDIAMLEDVQSDEWRDATDMLVEELEAASNEIGYNDPMLRLEEEHDGARMFAKERWKEERLL